MFGSHKFRIGERVRPSQEGKAACLFRGQKALQSGVVTKVDQFNCPTVLWDGRRTASGYHADFIMPDRRRKK
jgi:hypothetical protein